MEHGGRVVEDAADPVAAEVAHDGEAVALREFLDCGADLPQRNPGFTASIPRIIAS